MYRVLCYRALRSWRYQRSLASRATLWGPLAVAGTLCVASSGCSEPPPTKGQRKAESGPVEAVEAGVEGGPASTAQDAPELPAAPANGFGDEIAWRSLDAGLEEAKRSGRPLMLVVHTSWCARCKALKPQFAAPDVERLAQNFVMVNVDQDEDERVMEFGPDGTYIPRVMFLDPSGQLDPAIGNDRSPKFKYFYTSSIDLVKSMHVALQRHGKPT